MSIARAVVAADVIGIVRTCSTIFTRSQILIVSAIIGREDDLVSDSERPTQPWWPE
jgi:hypothetical protein